ncbi:MAG: Wzz/FepE/Etk N-terminal domain-containing protein [Lutibacter sp.]
MADNQQYIQNQTIEDSEFDFKEVVQILLKGKRFIFKIVLIFLVIGTIFSFLKENQYTATSIFIPQVSNGKELSGGIGGLAALAGINLTNNIGETGIPPNLYPQVLFSDSFLLELLNENIVVNNNKFDSIPLKEYLKKYNKPSKLNYLKKYTIGLPGLIISSIFPAKSKSQTYNLKGILKLSSSQQNLVKALRNILKIDINSNEGFIKISSTTKNPFITAQIAHSTQQLLQKKIIDFGIKKSKDELTFIKKRYDEKKKELILAQNKLAQFSDRNRMLNSALAQTQNYRLQANFDIVNNVFLDLAKQLESQTIKVKQDTPIFTVIKPVSVPTEKSAPDRFVFVLLWVVLGLILSTVYVLSKHYYHQFQMNKK